MHDEGGRLPPLPPSPFPDDLVAHCRAALVSATVRTERATLEVHRTHLRVVTEAVTELTAYSRRMQGDDLVVSFEQISTIRPVGVMSMIIEMPRNAAIALTGPSVRATLRAAEGSVNIAPRQFRPFFMNFWLIHHRPGRVEDARRLP